MRPLDRLHRWARERSPRRACPDLLLAYRAERAGADAHALVNEGKPALAAVNTRIAVAYALAACGIAHNLTAR